MGKLIWLASYPKSGNTWLRAFLHNYLRDRADPQNINALRDLTAIENDAGLYHEFDPRPASSYTMADIARMRPLVHRKLTTAFPDYVFVKTHNALLLQDGVPLITKEVTAAAIYIVRDPRDIALSYSHHLSRPLDAIIEFMAAEGASGGGTDDHIHETLGSWSTHVSTWTGRPSPRLLVLRYEDMLSAPFETFGKVVRFLGDSPAEDRLRRAIGNSDFAQLSAQESAEGFIERPETAQRFFLNGRAGEWRKIMTDAQRRRLEQRHTVQMTRFGYL